MCVCEYRLFFMCEIFTCRNIINHLVTGKINITLTGIYGHAQIGPRTTWFTSSPIDGAEYHTSKMTSVVFASY